MNLEFDSPISRKNAFYAMASKAQLVEHKAKLAFEREPYYLKFMKRREENHERDSSTDVSDGI